MRIIVMINLFGRNPIPCSCDKKRDQIEKLASFSFGFHKNVESVVVYTSYKKNLIYFDKRQTNVFRQGISPIAFGLNFGACKWKRERSYGGKCCMHRKIMKLLLTTASNFNN